MLPRDPLPFSALDRYGDRGAAHDLMQVAADDDVRALADRRTVGNGADLKRGFGARRRIVRERSGRVDSLGKTGNALPERRLEGRTDLAGTGVDRPERAARPLVAAKNHRRMVEEVAVDRDRRFAVRGLGQGLGGFEEVGTGRLGAGLARLEEEQVDDDVGAGLGAHGARRKSDGTDEVSPLPEIRPCRLIGLVHRPAADDERANSAGPEVGERTGDERVVQRERQPPIRFGHAHRAVGERRVADHEVEATGELRLGEVLGADRAVGIEKAGDFRGDRVGLDAGVVASAAQRLRLEGNEKARAAPGLEHTPAGKAEAGDCRPEGADEVFRGVVRVLGGTGQAREFRRRHEVLERRANCLPACPERGAGAAEHRLRKLAAAERAEPDEARLLLRRRGALLGLDLPGDSDRLDVVQRPALPALRKPAIAGKPERDGGRLGRSRRTRDLRWWIGGAVARPGRRLLHRDSDEGGGRNIGRRERGAGEQVQAHLARLGRRSSAHRRVSLAETRSAASRAALAGWR